MPPDLAWAYRNRAKLAVGLDPEGSGTAIGLYGRGGNRIVDLLADCRVQTAASLRSLGTLRDWLDAEQLARPVGSVKYVDLREAAEGRQHLTLVFEATSAEGLSEAALDRLLERLPGLVGVSINLHPTASSYAFGPTTRTVRGRRSFEIDVAGPDGRHRRFEVPATGFFQVSTFALAAIHARMVRHLAGVRRLADLYCGVGLHGLTLASLLGQEAVSEACIIEVVGIDGNKPGLSCARRNADRLGVRARYKVGAVEQIWPGWSAESSVDGVVLNPGRSGCRPGVLQALLSRPNRAVYLSCEPTTQARDVAVLAERDWKVVGIVPFDLMPQTDQVEVLALLDPPAR